MNNLIFRQCGKDGYYKIWHRPEKNIFIFVESGEGSIVLRDGSHPITKGTLCFIGENRYHYTFPKEPSAYVRSKLSVGTDIIKKLIEASDFNENAKRLVNGDSVTATVVSGEEYERVSNVFKRLSTLSQKEEYIQPEYSIAVLQLILTLTENFSSHTEKAIKQPDLSITKQSSIQSVIEYINTHVSEDISIDKISESCFISKYHLCRIFKKKMGLTVMEYILETRLTMARELLGHGAGVITDVAVSCGFGSPSYFSRVFKARYGINPSRYAKNRKTEL